MQLVQTDPPSVVHSVQGKLQLLKVVTLVVGVVGVVMIMMDLLNTVIFPTKFPATNLALKASWRGVKQAESLTPQVVLAKKLAVTDTLLTVSPPVGKIISNPESPKAVTMSFRKLL